MKTLLCGLILLATPAGADPPSHGGHFSPRYIGGAHFSYGTRWHRGFARRGRYFFTGASWIFVPFGMPYGGDWNFDDDVYQGAAPQETYPSAQPTSNPDIVISPFPPNAMIDVSGIPQGAKVMDPASGQVFLRP